MTSSFSIGGIGPCFSRLWSRLSRPWGSTFLLPYSCADRLNRPLLYPAFRRHRQIQIGRYYIRLPAPPTDSIGRYYGIYQAAYFFYFDYYLVTRLQPHWWLAGESDALGGAG